jgi:hypothetical protein
VFVGGADEHHLVPARAQKAGIKIGWQLRTDQVSQMLYAVDIGQGRSDEMAGHSGSCEVFRPVLSPPAQEGQHFAAARSGRPDPLPRDEFGTFMNAPVEGAALMRDDLLQPATVLSLLLASFLTMLSVDLVHHESVEDIFKEGRAIEFFSAGCYLVAAVLLIAMLPAARLRSQWHLPVILVLMTLREFDLDKSLTSEGVLQLRLYSGPAPWIEKIVGAMVVALILVCGWRLATRTVPPFLRGLRGFAPESWLVLFAGAAIVVSKSLDGLGRKLAAFGYKIGNETAALASKSEEMLELVASMMLVMAVVQGCRRWSRR